MSLSRNVILSSASHLPNEEVSVPEWGGSVRVRGLNAGERDQLERWVTAKKRPPDFRARVVQIATIDEEGNPLFTPVDIPAISNLPAGPVERLFDTIIKLSGLNKAEADELSGN